MEVIIQIVGVAAQIGAVAQIVLSSITPRLSSISLARLHLHQLSRFRIHLSASSFLVDVYNLDRIHTIQGAAWNDPPPWRPSQ
jgi:hypothetical protein